MKAKPIENIHLEQCIEAMRLISLAPPKDTSGLGISVCLLHKIEATTDYNIKGAALFEILKKIPSPEKDVFDKIAELKKGDWFKCDRFPYGVCVERNSATRYSFLLGAESIVLYKKNRTFRWKDIKDNFVYLGEGIPKNLLWARFSKCPYKWSQQMEEEYIKQRIRVIGY